MSAGPLAEGVPSFAELAAAAADVLGHPVPRLTPEVRLTAVCRDSLDLYCLHVVADGFLPGFELPAQLDVGVATLGDLHHYLVTAIAQRRAEGADAPPGRARHR